MAILVKVNESGRSQKSKFIIIPKQVVKELNWKVGDRLYFDEFRDCIQIHKVNGKEYDRKMVRKLRFNGYSYAVTIPKIIAENIQADWLELKKSRNKIIIRLPHR